MAEAVGGAPDRLGRAKSDLDEDSDAVVSPTLLLIRIATKVLASPFAVSLGVAIGAGTFAAFLTGIGMDLDNSPLSALGTGGVAFGFSLLSLPQSLAAPRHPRGRAAQDAWHRQHEDLGKGGKESRAVANRRARGLLAGVIRWFVDCCGHRPSWQRGQHNLLPDPARQDRAHGSPAGASPAGRPPPRLRHAPRRFCAVQFAEGGLRASSFRRS